MRCPELGHALIINNLATEIPKTEQHVEDLKSNLETIGIKVKSYKDVNFQVRKILIFWPFSANTA